MRTKAVIYVRVSSEEQNKEGFSIPAQIELLQNYALKNDIEVVKLYKESHSAKVSGRPQFNEMLNFLKKSSNVKTILVEKTDRLYRNFKDYVSVGETDYVIHLVKENQIIEPESNSHTKLMHGFKVLMAKSFIDNLKEETQKGRLRKVEEGYFIGQVPYGYKKLDKNTTVPHEEKSKFVKRAFELYSQGDLSLKTVSDILYKEKYIYLPSMEKISTAQLDQILKNRAYTGVIPFKGNIYKGKHEAIISESLFEKAQRAFKKDNKPLYRKNHDFMFSGMMKCGECGSTITAEIKKRKYIYYRCTGGHGKCSQKSLYIREEELTKQFNEAVRAIKLKDDDIEFIKICLKASLDDKIQYTEERIVRIEAESKKIRERLNKLYLDKLDGEISNEFWRTKKLEWEGKLRENENELHAYTEADKNYYEKGNKIVELVKNTYTTYLSRSNEEKKKLLKILLSNIFLTNGKASYTYNLPFSYFINFGFCQEKYPGLDSNQ